MKSWRPLTAAMVKADFMDLVDNDFRSMDPDLRVGGVSAKKLAQAG
jgi:hypothetical protein